MISKIEASKKLKELTENKSIKDPIGAFLEFMKNNYNELDGDAKEWIDNAIEGMLGHAGDKIDDMTDSLEKRALSRELGKSKGEHFDSQSLINILENRTQEKTEILNSTRIIFKKRLQNYLDFLYDASKKTNEGPKNVAIIGLFYLCVDELLVAFHLSQLSFINQAYTHIRSIWEHLDKIELFSTQPEFLELWFSEDPKEIKKVLKAFLPASVRESLGKERYDPVYSFFSELGPHGTFKSIQSRSAIKKSDSDLDKKTIKFWIGGVPFEHNVIFLNTFLIITLFKALSKVLELFSDSINVKEAEKIISESMTEQNDYFSSHVFKWAENNQLDVTAISQWIEEVNKNIEKFKVVE